MHNKFAVLILLFLFAGCRHAPQTSASLAEPVIAKPTDYFSEKTGCFLLYNMKTKNFDKVIGDPICKERFPACSTFKVPLAIIAFDKGLLKDENTKLKWDGVKDPRSELNRDQTAKTWMRDSVVWFSQRLTTQLGEKNLQKYLGQLSYGNEDISAGLTQAWLVAPNENQGLKITAYEQVDFMTNLWTDTLPVSKRAMKLAREITSLETSPKGFQMHGKTGSNFFDLERRTRFGWFIAHIENKDQEYIVVTNFSDLKPGNELTAGGPEAKEITKKILSDQDLW